MSLFKEKRSKSDINYSKSFTIDEKHMEQIQKFQQDKDDANQYKKDLVELEKQLAHLSEKSRSSMNDEELDHYFKLKDDIEQLQVKIQEIESNNQENNYYLDTGHLMFHYYDKFKNQGTSNNNSYYVQQDNKKSVLDFFHKQSKIPPKQKTAPKQNNKNYSKSEIINSYLMKVDDNFIYPFDIDNSLEFCQKCNNEKTIIASEGIVVCTKCGVQNNIIIDSDKPSYKDPPREISYFAYKRINHFNEWLAQFQAKESTEIPQEVFDKILIEIKKERIVNMASLTPVKLREILKKLKLNKYYEHVPHIINRLNGLPAPVMTRDTEEKLRMMFKEIQTPFLKHCPKDRKNFLSYSYVLHKFVQLLEMDEFLICFPLLKSREKLHQQDQIWKKICEELHWEFIKSL